MGLVLSKKLDSRRRRKNQHHHNHHDETVLPSNNTSTTVEGCLNGGNTSGDNCDGDKNGSQINRKALSITYKMFQNVDLVDSYCFDQTPQQQNQQQFKNKIKEQFKNNEEVDEERQQQSNEYVLELVDQDDDGDDEVDNDIIFLTGFSQELQLLILSYLGFRDIISVQKTCKYWYNVGRDTTLWRGLIERELQWWTNKERIQLILSTYSGNKDNIRWKRVYCDLWRWRQCNACGKQYRQCRNTKRSCNVHSDIRDIVHSRGVPSGVYWICCLAKPKDAAGCITTLHKEADEKNYPKLPITSTVKTVS